MTTITMTAPTPFDMGRVVKRTFSTLGEDLPTFGVLALIAAAPVALQAWFQFRALAATTGGNPLAALGSSMAVLLCVLVSWAVISVVNGAITKAAVSRFNGQPMTVGESLSEGAAHGPSIMLVGLLVGLGVGAASILLLVPGLMLAIRWLVAVPAQVIENTGASASISRSAQLTKGHRWAIFGLALMFIMALGLIELTLAALGGGLGAFMIPEKRKVITIILTPVLQLIAVPVSAVGLAAMYAELRGGAGAQVVADVFS